jgi:hypothetical protein
MQTHQESYDTFSRWANMACEREPAMLTALDKLVMGKG